MSLSDRNNAKSNHGFLSRQHGCHDVDENSKTTMNNKNISGNTSKKTKSTNRVKISNSQFRESQIGDEDDFRTKKKRRIHGRSKSSSCSFEKNSQLTTRQRKTAIAPLIVCGGNPKERAEPTRTRSGKVTNTKHPVLGFSKNVIDNLSQLDKESSGSQTSDFELRLSDSSSDVEDFVSKKKVPRSVSEERNVSAIVQKSQSLHVTKHVVEINYSSKHQESDTEFSDEGTHNRESSSSNQTKISKIVKSNSQRLAPSRNFESRKRKRTRSKKATFLEFSNAGKEAGTNKSSFSNTGSDKTGMLTRLSSMSHCTNAHQNRDETSLGKPLENSGNNEEKEKDVKVPTRRTMLDACVKLEKISVKELKMKNSGVKNKHPFLELKNDFKTNDEPHGGSEVSPGVTGYMDERQRLIEDQETRMSPEISVVCDSFNTGDDVGSHIDVREPVREGDVARDIDEVSPEISVVCDSFNTGDDVGSHIDVREPVREGDVARDIDEVSPEISVVCDSFNTGDDVGSHIDVREPVREGDVARDIDEVSPQISVVCDSFDVDGMGSGKDIIGPEGEEDGDLSGISVVCDSFTIDEEEEPIGVDIRELIKDIASPDLCERKEPLEGMSMEVQELVEGNDTAKDSETPECCENKASLAEEKIDTQERNEPLEEKINIQVRELMEGNDSAKKRGSPKGSPRDMNLQSYENSEKNDHGNIWRPVSEAPSRSYVLETRRVYGLPHERHQKAFCSEPKDIPAEAR